MAAVVGERHELLTPQQMMQIASMDRAEPETDPIVLRVAAQLSWLASQHHISEYNQLKFGPKGAAASYIPLTVLLPAHVKELRVYQQFNAQKQAWWFSPKPRTHAMILKDALSRNEDVSENANELQDALSQAMESPLPPLPMHLRQLSNDQTRASAKTSDSHPINMSPMVPFELLFRLHSYLRGSPDSSHPTYLHLPYELTLDALTAPAQSPSFPDASTPIAFQNNQSNGTPTNTLSAIPASMIQADVMDDVPTPPPAAHTSPKLRIDAAMVPLPESPEMQRHSKLPLDDREGSISNDVEPPSYFTQPLSSTISNDIHEATTSTIDFPLASQRASKQNGKTPSSGSNGIHPVQNGANATSAGDEDFRNFLKRKSLPVAVAPAPPIPKLGNLMLSSCPGKKVRLQGPVKGRGTICRDLGRDLQRIRDSGVGCIVCCLDDSELHFLGAPWDDYSREASQLGIDILRLPTPEGFAPLDPGVLNAHIDHIISQYTLRGISILVHCRGGVGRAGLVACCWMLKMGLCGWIRRIDYPPRDHPYHALFNNSTLEVSPDPPNGDADPFLAMHQVNGTSSPHTNGSSFSNGIENTSQSRIILPRVQPQHIPGLVRLDTMDLVERAIRVVRRRRSVKAIETFEQVHFLVQFVEFLRGAPPPMAAAYSSPVAEGPRE